MSSDRPLGVVAAGHELSARAGADALRAGGNAVDAALGALLTSFTCEPLLTGLGAGGYMLVIEPGRAPVVLDFFVEAPGRGVDHSSRAELIPVSVSFGDAVQIFNIGPASVGSYGMPAGVAHASARFGRLALSQLVAPAVAHARAGVMLVPQQAYVVEILGGLVTSTPEASALFAPGGGLLGTGDIIRQDELADALELLGAEGAEPFYRGAVGAAIVDWLGARGGMLTTEDLNAYEVIERDPVHALYRGREVVTNPPPSAGGILIARALGMLDARPSPLHLTDVIDAMQATQAARTTEFLEGLTDPEFVRRFLTAGGAASPQAATPPPANGSGSGARLGSTTHVAVMDRDGWACSVTSSNGSSSGVIVPGTGVHLNNMLGEQDLNPRGFHQHSVGRRLPSMMAPTVVLRDDRPELVLGSAGSNRIRSAILQTIVRVLDDGLRAGEAVQAPRAHYEDGIVYTEPGIDVGQIDLTQHAHSEFRERNLFFGGVQAVERDADGCFWGGGDPRRGGASIVVFDHAA
ncbi:MAG: gamma-glutamyltransferase family protein [Solirubrobacteraceae bacterium]